MAKEVKTTSERIASIALSIAALGMVGVVTLSSGNDDPLEDLTAPPVFIGRQLKGNINSSEFSQVKAHIKDAIDARPYKLSINEAFAIEDIINANCPNGFRISDVRGAVTIAQLKDLLDGNCGL